MIRIGLYNGDKRKGIKIFNEDFELLYFIPLSKIEYNIINIITDSKNYSCLYKDLLNEVYNTNIENDDEIKSYLPTLRVNINRINKKIFPFTKIINIYGRGYKLI